MSTTPATTPGSGLAESILKLRYEIDDLARQMADSNKTKEESDALLETFQRRKAHLDAMVSVSSAPKVGALANGVPVSGLSSVVPDDLPTFQWSGFVQDKTLRVFDDLEHCLSRFQQVLRGCNFNCDSEWPRLLPLCLSPSLNAWLDEFVGTHGTDASWSEVKKAMVARYAAPKEQLRFARVGEFLTCCKLNTKPVDVFLE